jgi:demethylmenaquinone methyltransferase/2-methoxy-6-polyprenyl-1,4-benzoquinol methylase
MARQFKSGEALMKFNSEEMKRLYTKTLPRAFGTENKNKSLLDRFINLQEKAFSFHARKREAVQVSNLKEGEKVIVFCCGTGFDFPQILERIGPNGSILGVDFSRQLLDIAQEEIDRNGWKNVELKEADVTLFENKSDAYFDAGICTLGICVIPEYRKAYSNLLSHVRLGGEVIIGDLQLATGWGSVCNPLVVFWTREYGATFAGFRNARTLLEDIQKELTDVRTAGFFFDTYRYCVGKKPNS